MINFHPIDRTEGAVSRTKWSFFLWPESYGRVIALSMTPQIVFRTTFSGSHNNKNDHIAWPLVLQCTFDYLDVTLSLFKLYSRGFYLSASL